MIKIETQTHYPVLFTDINETDNSKESVVIDFKNQQSHMLFLNLVDLLCDQVRMNPDMKINAIQILRRTADVLVTQTERGKKGNECSVLWLKLVKHLVEQGLG